MAVKRLKRANSSPALRERMEAREKAHRDYISFVHDAKVAAKAEGKIEDARKMKELGMDIDIIHQITGISRDDIERL